MPSWPYLRERAAAGNARPERSPAALSYTHPMLGGLATRALVHGARRVPGLRALPLVWLLAIAEIAVLARKHVTKLDGGERRRLVELMRAGGGRRRNLSAANRQELGRLVAKMEPRLFAGLAAATLSPVPIPRRLLHGRRAKP